jgi:uncharacterized protein (DUF1015 family)
MADVRPLRGVRFDRRVSGPIGPLIAPPYDVTARPEDGAEYSIGGVEYVDLGVPGDQHAFAARRYCDWRQSGVLVQDNKPAIYLHRHQFAVAGEPAVRTGFLARVRLADWTDRVVLPHERTTAGPRAERLARLRAVGANLSPLYFLYRDPDGAIRDLLSRNAASDTAADNDRMGGVHRLVPQTDPWLHRALAHLFANRTLFVADGHHRYEAALAYRDEQRQSAGNDADAPSEFVLALIAAVEDPGVIVRATHRVIVAGPEVSPPSLLDLLRRWFTVEPATGPLENAKSGFLARVVLPAPHGIWDVRAGPGNPHLELLTPDRGPAWKSLSVVSMEAMVNQWRSAVGNDLRVNYVVDEDDAVARVDRGEASAAILFPTPKLDWLLAVAEEGDLLPPKSTWFEPKAPAGLVINELHSTDRERSPSSDS